MRSEAGHDCSMVAGYSSSQGMCSVEVALIETRAVVVAAFEAALD